MCDVILHCPEGKSGSYLLCSGVLRQFETGAIAQNIQLQETAIAVGMVLVGGFDKDIVKSTLHLPNKLEPTASLEMVKYRSKGRIKISS